MTFSEEDLDLEKLQTLDCSNCNECLFLKIDRFEQLIDGIQVKFAELPILICPKCGKRHLSQKSRFIIKCAIEKSKKEFKDKFVSDRHTLVKRYGLCKKVDFKYDATDYEYIPGLMRQWNDGFLTPVFFRKKILHKFLSDDEYTVIFGSDTYGTIHTSEEDISFGITRNDKVIVWLGDLNEISLNEQHYFRSFNVTSDHDICSEFYQGQIEAKFTEQSQERKLLTIKGKFELDCKTKWNVKISRYEDNVDETLSQLHRPVLWNEQNVMFVINSLNKITNESFNTIGIKKEIEKFDVDFRTKELGSMKLLQKLIQLKFPELDAGRIMKPFFVLNDFRIVLDHKIDNPEEILDSCYERMEVIENKNFEILYDALFKEMIISYAKLNEKF